MVIPNTRPVPSFTVALGKTKYPEINAALAKTDDCVKKFIAFDTTTLKLQTGSVVTINMVMLGALVQTGAIPLFRQVIRGKTKQAFVAMNLKALDLGLRRLTEPGEAEAPGLTNPWFEFLSTFF